MNSGIKLLLWLFISILFIILIEFSLWLSWKVTKSHKLNTIYGNQISLRDQKEKLQFNSYINDPQNYLKIA